MMHRQFWHIFSTWFVLGALAVYGQSDNIVSKGTGLLLSNGNLVWVFDHQNLSFSEINFFTNPPEITATERDENPLTAAVVSGSNILGIPINELNDEDTTRITKLIRIRPGVSGEDNTEILSIILTDGAEAEGITIQDAATNDSVVVVAFGKGGVGVVGMNNGGTAAGVTLSDSVYLSLVSDSTPSLTPQVCRNKDLCAVDVFPSSLPTGSLVSVDVVAIFRDSVDSATVLLGSQTGTSGEGLRRWRLGESSAFPVTSQNLDEESIQKIFINPNNQNIWVFTEDAYFFSDDGGVNFRIPQGISNDKVISLRNPQAAFIGDTTVLNFDFSGNHPGVMYFVGDSLIVNSNEDAASYEFFFDLRLILDRAVELGGVATAVSGSEKAFVVGTKTQGIYYIRTGDSLWININRQTTVEKNLKEVITFPTMFNGTVDVGLGYQLEKSANVTITVFNYAMEKVKTLVKNSHRIGGSSRSENPQEDKWNGRDNNGEYVSAGLYYILVESDKGEKGWGKVMVVFGRQ